MYYAIQMIKAKATKKNFYIHSEIFERRREMTKPTLSDKQLDDIWFLLQDGEPLDNKTAKALFEDNCYYAGEMNKLKYEQRKERVA
ncbi:hypothetical protein [Paenibacillus harenae]|uniref:hypothetical protein n=1 Tax=Paenibacillus harenae TaxID=306543 RepID=UPI0027D81990|nr:hypothetical protein [Paenibacillus harenae]